MQHFDLQFVSDLFDRGTYIRDYGSKKETVHLDETKGKGCWGQYA